MILFEDLFYIFYSLVSLLWKLWMYKIYDYNDIIGEILWCDLGVDFSDISTSRF